MFLTTAKKPELYNKKKECLPKSNFVENKLSPSLISLSPLFKFHLSFLQQTLVQPFFLRLIKIQFEFK